MMTPGSANPLLLADAGYQIQRSVRLRSSASGYFSRVQGSATSTTTGTWSCWCKRGKLGVRQYIWSSSNVDFVRFDSADIITIAYLGNLGYVSTTALYRDPSAWYHIVLVFDTTNATAANRLRLFVNGVAQTLNWGATPQTQNATFQRWNVSGYTGDIADFQYDHTDSFDGYMADSYWIDGQALTPASFGEINPVTGVWSAKKYAGTYGTNGFFLNFSDNSAATAAAIGKDTSGNGNNWTPSGVSVTAGVTYDSMLDVPLGAGGPERGNYAVANPMFVGNSTAAAVSNGNLTVSSVNNASWYYGIGTAFPTSGKWYAEVLLSANILALVGVVRPAFRDTANIMGGNFDAYGYYSNNGQKYNGSGTGTTYGATWTTNDIIGIALDLDAGTLTFYKNGTTQGQAFSGITGEWTFACCTIHNAAAVGTVQMNFGQRPFAYTPPTGFKALHTGNLPEPVIKQGASYMAATTYTGNGSTQSISNAVNGVSFQPDFVWIKRRDAAASHALIDSVRGISNQLVSNLTNAEATGCTDGITSLNSNGFSLGAGTLGYITNTNGATLVGWQWKANGAAVSNTAGSITSQVSAGVSQGFSVVTYTGTGANATVGHGLGVAPKLIIAKSRTGVRPWPVYSSTLGIGQYLELNTTIAAGSIANYWGANSPTSTVFSLPNANYNNNVSGENYVAYCFSEVAGYSKFGSYTGNGSADGTFVYTGFRPRYVLAKNISVSDRWGVINSASSPYNMILLELHANNTDAEGGAGEVDFLSNGFKMRSGNSVFNSSGANYIFAAFAEHPFKNSLAR